MMSGWERRKGWKSSWWKLERNCWVIDRLVGEVERLRLLLTGYLYAYNAPIALPLDISRLHGMEEFDNHRFAFSAHVGFASLTAIQLPRLKQDEPVKPVSTLTSLFVLSRFNSMSLRHRVKYPDV